ncbi:hypothetical protein RCO48_20620 [Peribacillus frigoritolerans]|nr:hypothetical protein [Peribacillus frigoritolerans]
MEWKVRDSCGKARLEEAPLPPLGKRVPGAEINITIVSFLMETHQFLHMFTIIF